MTTTAKTGLMAVGIVLGGLVFLTVGGLIIFRSPSITPISDKLTDRVFERNAFEKLVEGKGRDEIIRSIGKPDIVEPDPYSSYERLIYKSKTRHKDAKETDAITNVLMKDRKCIGVTYKSNASE